MYATPQQQNIMKYPPCLPSKPRNVKAAKKSLRYFCMARNRDNNGDGKIDRSELRWYTASIKQLVGLYVGNGNALEKSFSRTYWSFGMVPGINKDGGNKYGYAYRTNIYLATTTHSETTTRCVRDIRVN